MIEEDMDFDENSIAMSFSSLLNNIVYLIS